MWFSTGERASGAGIKVGGWPSDATWSGAIATSVRIFSHSDGQWHRVVEILLEASPR